MWHWPLNWQLKGHKQFWFKLALVSFLGHLVVLSMLFWNKKKQVKLTVFAQPRSINVVLMPLYKKTPHLQKKLAQAKSVPAKKIEQPVSKKTNSVVSKVQKPKEVAKKKVVKKTKVQKQKKPVKKNTKPKEQLPKKIEPVLLPESVVVPIAAPVLPVEPIYIGWQDLKDLQLMGELEQVLIANWQPPVGFNSDLECVVELVVGADGQVQSLEIKKSSQVLAYDMSVRRNFANLVLPKIASNKTLIISFKP